MVSLDLVQTSNATIPTSLPSGVVAVFAGGTSGIGEATLKKLAQIAVKPRIYIVGRSSAAAERIIAECRTSNPEGEFVFIQKDLDLMKNIVEVCDDIKSREKSINILALSFGAPDLSRGLTAEGLHRLVALTFYGRVLFIIRLLPLLQAASGLSRVLNIASGGGLEGLIDTSDFPALKMSIFGVRKHLTSTTTLVLEHVARKAPNVSIITGHPGTVYTPLIDAMPGILGMILRLLLMVFNRWMTVPLVESAERHVFMATSSAFPSKSRKANGLSLVEGLDVHGGSNGEVGSGVYSVNWANNGPGEKALKLLDGYRNDGTEQKLWDHVQGELERTTGEPIYQ